MGIRESTLWVMRAGIATGVRFSFVAPSGINVEVNDSTFQRIINKIESGDILLDENLAHLSDPRAAAEYHTQNSSSNSPKGNVCRAGCSGSLVIPPAAGHFQEGAILHEAIHASFDLTFSNFPMLEEETAAYIAGAFYYKAVNLRFGANSPVYFKAQNLVDSVRRNPSVTPVIPTSDVANLVEVIGVQPLYMSRRGYASYPHNG